MLTRRDSILASRVVIVLAVAGSTGSFFHHPSNVVEYVLDIVVRAYLHFVAGAMAHEGVHGHLGSSKPANRAWTHLALLPTTVPSMAFRKTHLLHHSHTNERGKDPDLFLETDRAWEIPFRALAMPHHWVLWLRANGRLKRADVAEWLLTYAAYAAVYAGIVSFVGAERFLSGLIPAAVLHSLLLWFFFAIKTHEGYSTGSAESRSHNYYGRWAFWLSFGLSMHRVHHLHPNLGWLQMLTHVPAGTRRQRLTFRRDVLVPLPPGGDPRRPRVPASIDAA